MHYHVAKEEGVDINGNHYQQGHDFFWEVVPANIQSMIDDNSIASGAGTDEVIEVEAVEVPPTPEPVEAQPEVVAAPVEPTPSVKAPQ